MGAEKKFIDGTHAPANLTTSWALVNPSPTVMVSTCSQGDSQSNCDGRVYFIKSVHVRGRITYGALEGQVSPAESNLVRIIMFLDTQANGAVAAVADVMDTLAAEPLRAFRNLEFTQRFRILGDKTFYLTSDHMVGDNVGPANYSWSQGTKLVDFDVSFKTPLKVNRSGTTNAIASIADNAIHVMAIHDTGNTANTQFSYISRMRFFG